MEQRLCTWKVSYFGRLNINADKWPLKEHLSGISEVSCNEQRQGKGDIVLKLQDNIIKMINATQRPSEAFHEPLIYAEKMDGFS